MLFTYNLNEATESDGSLLVIFLRESYVSGGSVNTPWNLGTSLCIASGTPRSCKQFALVRDAIY